MEAIHEAYSRTPQNHLDTIRLRESGSRWGKAMSMQDFRKFCHSDEWHHYPHRDTFKQDGCEYYYIEIEDYPSLSGSVVCVESIRMTHPDAIELRHGVHGLELVSDAVGEKPANDIWMIVGGGDSPSIWTVHPGRPMKSLKFFLEEIGLEPEQATVQEIKRQAIRRRVDIAVKKK